ncbi:MAG TPA: hypothetical protein VGM90_29700 [Kofleriaceae bacterium]|jgi:hypothetical protein
MPGESQLAGGSPVDLAHSVLFFTTASSDPGADNVLVEGELTATGYRFTRGGVGSTVRVELGIVTWDGWTVERGVVPTNGMTDVDVTIPAVDLAHSFPLISYSVSGGVYGAADQVGAELLDATRLHLRRRTVNAADLNVAWQVVTIPDATIVHDAMPFSGLMSSQGISPIDATRTFLVHTSTLDTAANAASLLIESLEPSGGTIGFAREASVGTADLSYYAVELAQGHVDKGEYAWSANESDHDISVPGPQSAAFAFMQGGRSTSTVDAIPGRAWSTMTLVGDKVRLHRELAAATASGTVYWQRIELQR